MANSLLAHLYSHIRGSQEDTKAKVVVACRPEYRRKDEYVKEIIEKFEDISD